MEWLQQQEPRVKKGDRLQQFTFAFQFVVLPGGCTLVDATAGGAEVRLAVCLAAPPYSQTNATVFAALFPDDRDYSPTNATVSRLFAPRH